MWSCRAKLRVEGRKTNRCRAGLVMCLAWVGLLCLPTVSLAETFNSFIVGNDRGGYLHDRIVELENLQRHGVQIEIRGRVCFSTCTMFLGLPGTCVEPRTVFGFHGPSRGGRRLSKEDFDYFSQVMAAYYPEPLRSWFMETGRNRIHGVHKIKGAELIRMGVPRCRPA